MSVNLNFSCGGTSITEVNALNFGIVQAGTNSAIKVVTVSNTGTSDALNVIIEPMFATQVNGFSADFTNLATMSAQDTYLAQKFAANSNASVWYPYAVVGDSKVYATKVGGTLINTTGSDSFATYWSPPANATAGDKVWGNRASCQYTY